MYKRSVVAASLVLLGMGIGASADVIEIDLPGVSDYDGWEGLTSANYPGYGAFPGTSDWPAPIGSNTTGSGDAELDKLANGTSGGPFLSGAGIYFGGFSGTPDSLGGTLGVSDASPVDELANVVLQLKISEAYGFDFFNNLPPTLAYNGGAQALAADNQILISQEQDGTFVDPTTGEEEPVYINTYLFQWDLSAVEEAIGGFGISFSGVQHAQLTQVRLDQSDVYELVTVPEPSGLLAAGAMGALLLRRRRRADHA